MFDALFHQGVRKGLTGLLLPLFLVFAGCSSGPVKQVETDPSGTAAKRVIKQTEPLTEPQQALMLKARQASDRQDWAAAAQALETLRSQRPEVARIHSRLGWVRQQQGDRDAAITLYREAVALDPGESLTVNNLALLLKEDKAFAEAAALLKDGLRYSPEVPELHYNLGVLYELYLLDLEAALMHYRRYRDLSGQEDKRVAGWIADLERRVD